MFKGMLVRVLALSVLLCGLSSMALAQVTAGTISGTITDPSGAIVPGATVTATNRDTGLVRSATSSGSGDYVLTELDPGVYKLSVAAAGFATNEEAGIQVDVAAHLGINFTLEVGKGTTTVEVTGAAPLVETTNSTLSDVVTQEKVVDLPLNGRDPYNLISLEPGITPGGTAGRGEQVSSNGQREASANFMLDGADNNAVGVTGFNTQVALDDVREFRVLTNNYSAEFGRNTGFIADAITKSGTNQFHGVAYDFLRNSALDTASFTNNATPGSTKDVLRRNQFGGDIGGPIRKDKAFFFGSFEAIRVRPGAVLTPFLVPTAHYISTLPAGSFAAQILSKYPPPAPNAGGFSDSFGNTTCAGAPCTAATADVGLLNFPSASGTDNTYYWTTKIDYNFNDANRLTGAFHYERDRLPFNGNLSPYSAFTTPFVGDDRNFSLDYTHTFSPTLINEARAGLNRGLANFPAANIFPTLVEDTLGVALPGTNTNLPQDFTENTIFVSDLLTKIKGRSTYKFGGDYRRIRNGSTFAAEEGGFYEFDSLGTPAGAPNFCDPTFLGCSFSNDAPYFLEQDLNPSASTVQLPEFYRGYRENEMSLFIQDDLKATRKLTLNLGLRWEYFGPPHNFRTAIDSTVLFGSGSNIFQREQGAFFSQVINNPGDLKNLVWHKQYKNFAPRLGFAYDVFGNGKTAIRGGAGIGYDRLFNNVFENIRFNPPDFCFCDFGPNLGLDPFTYNPFDPVAGLSTVPQSGASVRHVDQNIKTSYADNYFFGIEQQLPHDAVLKVNYVGTGGVKLYTINNINRRNSGQFLNLVPGCDGLTVNCGRLSTLFSSDNFRSNDAHSTYNALQVELNRRFAHGLGLQVSYTWSHALTNLSDAFVGSGGQGLGFTQAFNPAADKGNAEFDVRHILQVNYNYELPFYREQQGLVGHVLGGWSINGITSYRTGQPFTVFDSSGDPNLDRVLNDRVNVVGPAINSTLSKVDPSGSPIIGGVQLLNISSFQTVTPALNAAGTESQGEFFQPGNWNYDFGVHKDIRVSRLGEGGRIEYRAEFFNLFNHPNLGGPDASINSGTFGQATFTGQRLIQMALKIYF